MKVDLKVDEIKSNKNILVLTTFYPPASGGIQTYSYEIVKNLVKLGCEVTTFALTSDGIKSIFSSPSFKIYKNNKKNSLKKIFSKFDVIFVTSWFPIAIFGLFLSKLFSSKLFIVAHGNEILYPKKYPLLSYLMKICFRNAYQIIAVSSYTKSLLENIGVEEKKIAVIPNGTNPDQFCPDVKFDDIKKRYNLENKKIIFSLSRLVERKNFGIVIESMIEILREVSNVVYIIAGEGPMKDKWIKLAIENGVKDQVIFAGYISDKELPKYYTMCDVFVLPSKEIIKKDEVEGFGITLLEANACGKPVVGGRSGGIEDAIVDGKTGILVNPKDKNEVKTAILKILKNPSFAKTLGRNGRKRIEKELSWIKVTKKIKKQIFERRSYIG